LASSHPVKILKIGNEWQASGKSYMAEVLIGYTNFSLQHLFLDQATLGVGQRNVSQSDVSLCLANVNSIANIFKTENTWFKFHVNAW